MGKAGKAKKRGSRRSQPFNGEDRSKGTGNTSIIFSMISSIDEKKRISALDLILHICKCKSTRKNLHQLFSKDLCNHLSVRLIDTNEETRTKTSRVLDVVASLGTLYCELLLKYISLELILRLLLEAAAAGFDDYARHLLNCATNIAYFVGRDFDSIDNCIAFIFRLYESRSSSCAKFAYTRSLIQLSGGEITRSRLVQSPNIQIIKTKVATLNITEFSSQDNANDILSAACVFVSSVLNGGTDCWSDLSELTRKAFCLISQVVNKELEVQFPD
jgi:hypothetical protein